MFSFSNRNKIRCHLLGHLLILVNGTRCRSAHIFKLRLFHFWVAEYPTPGESDISISLKCSSTFPRRKWNCPLGLARFVAIQVWNLKNDRNTSKYTGWAFAIRFLIDFIHNFERNFVSPYAVFFRSCRMSTFDRYLTRLMVEWSRIYRSLNQHFDSRK